MLSTLAVCSCSTVDPARTQEIDRTFHQTRSETRLNGARTDWQPGQWVLLKVDSSGEKWLRRITVGGKEGTAYWVELHDLKPEEDSRLRLLIDGFDPGSPRRLRVLKARLSTEKENLELAGDEVDGPRARPIQERSIEFLARLRHLQALGRQRDTTVAAGTFKDTKAAPMSITAVLGTWTGYVWYTNAVPVIYYARSEMTYSPLFSFVASLVVEEVVDFGNSEGTVADGN